VWQGGGGRVAIRCSEERARNGREKRRGSGGVEKSERGLLDRLEKVHKGLAEGSNEEGLSTAGSVGAIKEIITVALSRMKALTLTLPDCGTGSAM